MAPPAGQAASYHTTMAPPPVFPAGQQPSLFPPHRAPAALGAPPGEEFFPPQAHTVPAEVSTQSEGSIFTETSQSDWSTLQGPTTVDTDVWSVTSGAPSLVEQEATLGLTHLSEEAKACSSAIWKIFTQSSRTLPNSSPAPHCSSDRGLNPTRASPLPLISSGNTNVLPGELTKEHCPHWSVRSCSSPGTWTSSWPPRNVPGGSRFGRTRRPRKPSEA